MNFLFQKYKRVQNKVRCIFLVLVFSQMVPLQNFGILVAMSMIGSGLGALTLLPVILILHYRRKESIALQNKSI